MTKHKRTEVEDRLARIEGHLHAVHRMVAEDRSYPDVVRQVVAVRASLDAVVQVIVDDLVEECVQPSPKRGGAGLAARELQQVVASAL
jgi:CsoR family transcriptional regulator, copper-sensing transcriptional repressor